LAPQTWIPIATALLLQIDGMDTRLSRWAAEETPVFGSNQAASRASDRLRDAAAGMWIATTVATPSGEEAAAWLVNKLKGGAVELGARAVTYETVRQLKAETDRTRPDESDDLSFPFGHAASEAVYATLAAQNAASLQLFSRRRGAVQVGCTTIALACGWARVEGRHHYPSDVLVGLALGHFLGVFFTEAFLGLVGYEHVQVMATGDRDAARFGLGIRF
jgi:membrane-associated phospholipid phosphatase